MKTIASLAALLLSAFTGHAAPASIERFRFFEAAFEAQARPANPYTELDATAELRRPDGSTRTLPLFWDGGQTWKLRVSPDAPGDWSFTVRSSDAGLNGKAGEFACVASRRRGSIELMCGATQHFQYQNGERLWFMGDTAWALVADNDRENHDRASVERYLENRATQGFNVVHLMLLNEAGWGNSGGPPWRDLAKEQINPDYWREADARIAFANAQGLTVGLALAWGEKTGDERYPWGRFPSVEARKRYASYIAARYSAYDVYFIVSGEWHGEVKTRKSTEAEVKREFIAIGDALRAADPHRRMIGIHPMTAHGSTHEFNDAAWMSFGDYQQNYYFLHERIIESRRFGKPVVNSEYAYFLRDANGDGIVDKHHSYTIADIRHATWDIAMAGGYVVTGFGSTYMGGARHPTTFLPDDSANVPWIEQIQILQRCFTGLEWWKLEPHDELLTCATQRSAGRNRRVEVNDRQRTMNQTSATTYWCLAEPGKQYLLYARGLREAVNMKVENAASWRARLFNPRTGEITNYPATLQDDQFEFRPADEQDWLILLNTP